MGGLALLIAYTSLLAFVEIRYGVTVGEIVLRLIRLLAGG